MLELHGYCCLLAFFFPFACLFFFFSRLVLQPYAKDVAVMYDSVCLSRSCLASFRCPAVSASASACVCVSRSFSAPSFVCRTEGVPFFFCQTAPTLQLLCSMLKIHGRFLHMFWGLLPTRYRVAFQSRSCNLTPKLLLCFMMGSVCAVHVLCGPVPVEFVPFGKPRQLSEL